MGDVNGDGYDDMLYAFTDISQVHGFNTIRVTGIRDGQTGAFLPGHMHPSPKLDPDNGFDNGGLWGAAMCVIGDLDGDGANEYAISNDGKNFVKVYWGNSASTVFGDNLLCTIKQVDGPGSRFGYSLSTGGDLNGDGIPDLLIADRNVQIGGGEQISIGAVYLISGYELLEAYEDAKKNELNGIDVDPEIPSSANIGRIIRNRQLTGNHYLGERVFGGMDATGDGYPDILIKVFQIDFGMVAPGEETQSGALFYSGRRFHRPIHTFVFPPSVMTPSGLQVHTREWQWNFGSSMAFILNIENTPGEDPDTGIPYNTPDILIGAPDKYYHPQDDSGSPGYTFVFSSASANVLEVQKGTEYTHSNGTPVGTSMGSRVASAGDVNGDGFGDYFVAEANWRAQGAAVQLQSGRGQVFLVGGGLVPSAEQNTAPRLDSVVGLKSFSSYGSRMTSSGLPLVFIDGLSLTAPGFMVFSNEGDTTFEPYSFGSFEYH